MSDRFRDFILVTLGCAALIAVFWLAGSLDVPEIGQ